MSTYSGSVFHLGSNHLSISEKVSGSYHGLYRTVGHSLYEAFELV